MVGDGEEAVGICIKKTARLGLTVDKVTIYRIRVGL